MKVILALIKEDKTWQSYITVVSNNIFDINLIFETAKKQAYEDRLKYPESFPKDLIGIHPIKILKSGDVNI